MTTSQEPRSYNRGDALGAQQYRTFLPGNGLLDPTDLDAVSVAETGEVLVVDFKQRASQFDHPEGLNKWGKPKRNGQLLAYEQMTAHHDMQVHLVAEPDGKYCTEYDGNVVLPRRVISRGKPLPDDSLTVSELNELFRQHRGADLTGAQPKLRAEGRGLDSTVSWWDNALHTGYAPVSISAMYQRGFGARSRLLFMQFIPDGDIDPRVLRVVRRLGELPRATSIILRDPRYGEQLSGTFRYGADEKTRFITRTAGVNSAAEEMSMLDFGLRVAAWVNR